MRIVEISKIKIPKSYEDTPPKEYKIAQCQEYWNKFHEQDRYIVVNRNYVLVDGYAQYIALKNLGIDKCETMMFEGRESEYDDRWRRKDNTLYVWGKHYNKNAEMWSKEYVWRAPNSWIKDGRYKSLRVGDEVLVQTSRGVNLIYVTRLGNISSFPEIELPKQKIRKIVKNLSGYKTAVREYDPQLANMLGY